MNKNLDKLMKFMHAFHFSNKCNYDIDIITSLSAGESLHEKMKSILSYQTYFEI